MAGEEVAKLDQLDGVDRLPAQPVPADLGIGLEGLLRQPIRDDAGRADAVEPRTLDCVDTERASEEALGRVSKRSMEASSLTCQSACSPSPAYGGAGALTPADSSRPPL
jgi:hypothetical protein